MGRARRAPRCRAAPRSERPPPGAGSGSARAPRSGGRRASPGVRPAPLSSHESCVRPGGAPLFTARPEGARGSGARSRGSGRGLPSGRRGTPQAAHRPLRAPPAPGSPAGCPAGSRARVGPSSATAARPPARTPPPGPDPNPLPGTRVLSAAGPGPGPLFPPGWAPAARPARLPSPPGPPHLPRAAAHSPLKSSRRKKSGSRARSRSPRRRRRSAMSREAEGSRAGGAARLSPRARACAQPAGPCYPPPVTMATTGPAEPSPW